MSEQKQDPIIRIRSTSFGTSNAKSLSAKADKNRLQLRMSPEETLNLVNALTATLTTVGAKERGVKLDIHFGKRETNEGERLFDASMLFVKEVQEQSSGIPAGTTETFRPVTADDKISNA